MAIILQSCSVKEDRGPCPCHLNVDIKSCSAHTDKLLLAAWDDNCDNLFTDRIKLQDYPGIYARKVDKGSIHVCAFSGYEGLALKDKVLIIPEGKECGEVMAFIGESLDATGDSVEETVTLHKQYAKIHFLTDELTESIGSIIFRVVGTVNGFDIPSGNPSEGVFNAIAVKDTSGIRSLRVPRQIGDDLKLEIYVEGVLYGEVGIGEKISGSGYSWNEEDLRDIFLTVNLFSSTNVSVIINGWDTERIQYII